MILKIYSRLLLFLIVVTLIGCTSVHYHGKNVLPAYANGQRGHSSSFELKGKAKFYLWGLYPKKISVPIDEIAYEQGLVSISKIKIHEYISTWDTIWGVLSLGLYTPRTYVISGYAKK